MVERLLLDFEQAECLQLGFWLGDLVGLNVGDFLEYAVEEAQA